MQRSNVYVLYRCQNGTGDEYMGTIEHWRTEFPRDEMRATSVENKIVHRGVSTLDKAAKFTKADAFKQAAEHCSEKWCVGELVSDREGGLRVEE